MVNFGLLAAEIVSLVWGLPANFNGFRFLALLLQRRHSTEANQTLHNVWPLPWLVDYIYIFGGCCSVTEFCQVQNSLCVLQVLRSPICSITARQSSSGREPNFAALSTGCHLYSAGRPSGWALAHILVDVCIVIGVADTETLKEQSVEGARMGYTGKQVIHPIQVPIVQDAFSPSQIKVEWATELIKAFEEHQQSGKVRADAVCFSH